MHCNNPVQCRSNSSQNNVTAQRISSTAYSKNSPFPITLPSYFPTLSSICLDQKVEWTPLVKLLSRTILLFSFDVCHVSNCNATSLFLFFSFSLSFCLSLLPISLVFSGGTYILRVSMIYLPSVLVLLIDQIEKEFSVLRHIFSVHTQLFYTSHWSLCLLLQAQSIFTQNTQHVDIIFLVFSYILKISKLIFSKSYEPYYVTIFEQFLRKCISDWSVAPLRLPIYG